jgi:multiple sugar transport system ATP-binding protein
MNLLSLRLARENGEVMLVSPEGWQLQLSPENAAIAARARSEAIVLGARHSTLKLHKSAVPGAVAGQSYIVEPTGDITFVQVKLGSAIVVVSVEPAMPVAADEPVWIEFDQAHLHLFDGETQNALS